MTATLPQEPLSLKEVKNRYDAQYDDMTKHFTKIKRIGLLVVAICLIYFLIFGFQANNDKMFTILLFVVIVLGFGVSSLVLTCFVAGRRAEILYLSEYMEASKENIHNCEAYIQMPQMENAKAYVGEVKLQGRNLTNYECNLIIKQWYSLIES